MVVALVLPAVVYALVMIYGDDEARSTCFLPALIYWGAIVVAIVGALSGDVHAQRITTNGTVPWPSDPMCDIYWFWGIPYFWCPFF